MNPTRRGLLSAAAGFVLGAPLLRAQGRRARLRLQLGDKESATKLSSLQFVTPQVGFALGAVQRGGRQDPVILRTGDGGKQWTIQALPEPGVSLFFIDAERGWYPSELGIFRSDDSGKNWSNFGGPRGMERVYFLNRERGFAVGNRKRIYETEDGGESWRLMPAASQPDTTVQRTVYGWIDFADAQRGLISGWSLPVRVEEAGQRRQWPTLSILLDTLDGGKTWRHSTSSMFGTITRVRLHPEGYGLGLIEFRDLFDWPSEVFRIHWRTGKSERVFREARVAVRDIALESGGGGWLAGIGTSGAPAELERPGPLKLFYSKDLTNWEEVGVEGAGPASRRAYLSISGDGVVWVAVDGGALYSVAN